MAREKLTADQRRTLMGLGDLGVRAAVRALTDLLGEARALAISSVEMVSVGAAAGLVAQAAGFVACVAFRLYGAATARLAVLLPPEAALALVATLSGREVGRPPAFTEEDLSILKEVGNILGSAYVSAMANSLGAPILLSIPHLVYDRSEAVLAAALPRNGDGDADRALLVTRFADPARRIEGMILLLPEGVAPHGPMDRKASPR